MSAADEIARLAEDHEAGAAELARRTIPLVRAALAAKEPLGPMVRALCRAQPSMATFWRIAAEAVAAADEPQRFDRFVERLDRSRAALVRTAAAHLAPADADILSIVTLSASGSVRAVLESLAPRCDLRVSCSESLPAREGRTLAAHLAAAGARVTLYSDAALAHALPDADAVLVGADAIAPGWVLNKSGTLMLAAAAVHRGVPVYVLATRDKFVPDAIAERLTIREESPAEIWDGAPAAVEVRNPYFELTPAELVAAVITDIGPIGTGLLAGVCAASIPPPAVDTLLRLLDDA